MSELPPLWGRCATATFWLYLTTACVLFVVVAADQCRILFKLQSQAADPIYCAAILAAIFPFCLTHSLGALSKVTACCSMLVLVGCLFIVIISVEKVVFDAPDELPVLVTTMSSNVKALPVMAAALFGHTNFPRICAELGQGSRGPAVALWASGLSSLLYLVVGVAGYAAFGSAAPPDIIAGLAQGSTLWPQVLTVIFVVLRTPLMVFPLRSMCVSVVAPARGSLAKLGALENVLVTATLLTIIFVVAVVIPDLGLIMDTIGLWFVVPLMFIYPAKLAACVDREKHYWRIVCVGGLGVAILAGSSLIKGLAHFGQRS